MRFAAIILAAGKATRFGTNKLLEDLKGKPLIQHSIDSFLAHVETIIVVTGAYHDELSSYLSNSEIRICYNENYELGGMLSSILCGFNSLDSDIDGVFIHPADFPSIIPEDLMGMKVLLENHNMVVPYYQQKRGHPVLVNSSSIPLIIEGADNPQGLRGILNQCDSLGLYTTRNSLIHHDIDTENDLQSY
ncbi:MAG: nucleotidyltransferase family protein [Candidatus Heimdallarchaeota archaeon]|nr:nucleotidyltransferase family protein [Candidatus Heimdallarchaeota archaeon]